MADGRSVVREWSHRVAEYLHTFPDDHPTQIALRTYALAISLALGPTVAGFAVKPRWTRVQPLLRAVRRELGLTGFAFAITVAVAGGATLKSFSDFLERKELSSTYSKLKERLSCLGDTQKTFLANALSATMAILLMHHRYSRSLRSPHNAIVPKPSPTLDLTLLLFVRALDAVVRGIFFSSPEPESTSSDVCAQQHAIARRRTLAARLDAFVFWAASAR